MNLKALIALAVVVMVLLCIFIALYLWYVLKNKKKENDKENDKLEMIGKIYFHVCKSIEWFSTKLPTSNTISKACLFRVQAHGPLKAAVFLHWTSFAMFPRPDEEDDNHVEDGARTNNGRSSR